MSQKSESIKTVTSDGVANDLGKHGGKIKPIKPMLKLVI